MWLGFIRLHPAERHFGIRFDFEWQLEGASMWLPGCEFYRLIQWTEYIGLKFFSIFFYLFCDHQSNCTLFLQSIVNTIHQNVWQNEKKEEQLICFCRNQFVMTWNKKRVNKNVLDWSQSTAFKILHIFVMFCLSLNVGVAMSPTWWQNLDGLIQKSIHRISKFTSIFTDRQWF